MKEVVPRRFFTNNIKNWSEDGYEIIDFSKADVDLSNLPKFYTEKFEETSRKIEKNYLLNYLLINGLAYYRYDNKKYKFHGRLI